MSQPKPSFVVLDTSVLVADPEALFAYPNSTVVLPLIVIEELDGHKTRQDDVGAAARKARNHIESLRLQAGGSLEDAVQMPAGGMLQITINGLQVELLEEYHLDTAKADNRILASALGLKASNKGSEVQLVSQDVALRIKAASLGLVASEYVPNWVGRSTDGWVDVALSSEAVSQVCRARSNVDMGALPDADQDALESVHENGFAVVNRGHSSVLIQRRKGKIRKLGNKGDVDAWGLRARNMGQQFALELLMDPEIVIVALDGPAGTGKTITALAAGLEQVANLAATGDGVVGSLYDRLAIFRPIEPVGRAQLGFLPGDLEEKLEPWMAAIMDNLLALQDGSAAAKQAKAKELLEQFRATGQLTMESVTFLRGRSLHNSFIFVDEAQNLERSTIKTILTRVAEGSKIVFSGDTTQLDNPYCSPTNNGLTALIDAFGDSPLFGHVRLTECERSAVADEAAKRM